MKAAIAHATLVALLVLGGSGAVLAKDCGMNSNKPCLPTAKDLKMPTPPAGGCSMNSNKPCADEGGATAPARVQATQSEETAVEAKPRLSASDLKMKPKPDRSQQKEPAD